MSKGPRRWPPQPTQRQLAKITDEQDRLIAEELARLRAQPTTNILPFTLSDLDTKHAEDIRRRGGNPAWTRRAS